jgi:hypothetical protein
VIEVDDSAPQAHHPVDGSSRGGDAARASLGRSRVAMASLSAQHFNNNGRRLSEILELGWVALRSRSTGEREGLIANGVVAAAALSLLTNVGTTLAPTRCSSTLHTTHHRAAC